MDRYVDRYVLVQPYLVGKPYARYVRWDTRFVALLTHRRLVLYYLRDRLCDTLRVAKLAPDLHLLIYWFDAFDHVDPVLLLRA